MNTKKKIAIIGGGVSGLLSALEFQKRDRSVDIFDPDLLTGNNGFGFLLMPNGVAGLKTLGYWDDIVSKATAVNTVQILDDHQTVLSEKKVENIFGISRTLFLEALSNYLSYGVNRVAEKITFRSPQLIHSNQQTFEVENYEWILGCDGIHSQVRKMLFPDAEMLDAPTYEINGSFYDKSFAEEHCGKLFKIIFDEMGIAFGILPLCTGQIIWYLQLSRKHYPIPEENTTTLDQFVAKTLEPYSHPWIKMIVENHLHGLYLWRGKILLGVDQYIKGKFILLGDAAHIVLPFTSQGTNLAIDDIASLMNTIDHLETQDEIAIEHFNNRRSTCERIAFEGMEYAHLFSNNDSRFMINHMPLVFDQI